MAGTAVQSDTGTPLRVRVAGELERGDEVQALGGLGIESHPDGAVGQQDGWRVVFEDGGQRADGRLVAGDDSDCALNVGSAQMHIGGVVHEFPADQRVPHPLRAVQLPIRHAKGERGRDEPHWKIVGSDASRQGAVHRCDLGLDAQVALAVAERANHAPHRVVDLGDVLSWEAGRADPLDVVTRVVRDEGHCVVDPRQGDVPPAPLSRAESRRSWARSSPRRVVAVPVLPWMLCGLANSGSSFDRAGREWIPPTQASQPTVDAVVAYDARRSHPWQG
jgi:hypothetical protein